MLVTLSEKKVKQLIENAQNAIELPENLAEGWNKSPVDPMKLLHVFSALRLRQGFILRGYIFREEGNGNGIIWAMPDHSDFPEPDACTHINKQFLSPPKPPYALDELMEAIEGDGTPWSYFSASIFAREASEFGALWHGCSWRDQNIFLKDSWNNTNRLIENYQESEWVWKEEKPSIWEPFVEETDVTVTVNFFIYDPVGQERIIQCTDRFMKGRYTFKTISCEIAIGPGGIVY